MTKWMYPMTVPKSMYITCTDADLDRIEQSYKSAKAYNDSLNRELLVIRERMVQDCITLFGINSNPYKYITKQTVGKPWFSNSFDSIKREVLKAREHKAIADAKKKDEEEYGTLLERAVVYLNSLDLDILRDFTLDNAISVANAHARINEIERMRNEIHKTGDYVRFSGDAYCEDCRGWNGVDRRCDCGNRRVYWDDNGGEDFFLDPYVFGQAD